MNKNIIMALICGIGMVGVSNAANDIKTTSTATVIAPVKDAKECKTRKELSLTDTLEMNLATIMDRQDLLDKMLFVDCLDPNKPKGEGNEKLYPFFNVNSLDSLKKFSKAGANFALKDERGRGFLEYIISYQNPFIKPLPASAALKADIVEIIGGQKLKYLTVEEIKNTSFIRLNSDQAKYEELLKFIIDGNKEYISKPVGPDEGEESGRSGLTIAHYLAYNGLADTFQYAMEKDLLFNVNVKNAKGQPLLYSALYPSCGLDKKGLEGHFKIVNYIISQKNLNLDTKIIFNNDRNKNNLKGHLTFKDLLVNYKQRGNPQVFKAIMESFKKNQPKYVEDFNVDSYQANPNINSKEMMMTGFCFNLNEVNKEARVR